MQQSAYPSLRGTLQHHIRHRKTNIKPEIEWSQVCQHFSPGFEDLLDIGLNNDIYNPDEPLHM